MTTPYRKELLFGLLVAILTLACGGGGGQGTPTSPSPTASTPPASSAPRATPPPATPPPSTPPPSSTSSTMTFRVDGTTTTASSITAGFANGILSVGGSDPSRNTTLSFAVTPTAAGTGTYPLGPASAANAMMLVGNPASGWQAAVGIGSGSITVSTLTSTRAAGTFSFSLVAVPGTGATGTRTITEGAFDVTLTAVPAPEPTPTNGSTMSVLVDGVPWTSSLSRRATLTNNFLTITGQDTNFRVITVVVPLGAGVLIPPSSPVTISLDFTAGVHGVATSGLVRQNGDNGHDGGQGSFTVTSISATRVTGTFTVTLVNNPLNAAPVPTARLTSGTFDMALERF